MATEKKLRETDWFKKYSFLRPTEAENEIEDILIRTGDPCEELIGAFVWEGTNRGMMYWSTVSKEINSLTQYQIKKLTLIRNLERSGL